MPSKNSSKTSDNGNMTERSMPITVSPVVTPDGVRDFGGNLLAAWRGVFHLFGGRFESINVSRDGVTVEGFTTYANYDPQTIVDDVSGRDRRVDLLDAWPILQGEEPDAFATSIDMTKWMQQYYRKPGEDGQKSPEYVKKAIAAYKSAHEFPRRKGRPRKIVRIDQLGSLDESLLEGVEITELQKLQEKISQAIAASNK